MEKINTRIRQVGNRKKIISYVVWAGIFVMFFNVINHFQPFRYALISAAFDTLTLFAAYQVAARFLFTRYYGRKRQFLLISILVLIGLSIVFFLIDVNFIPRINNPEHAQPPVFFHLMRIIMGNLFMFFIAISLSLMEHNDRLRENEKMLTEEKLQTELKLLKAQINPHFIFNALNNIYALTYMKSKNAPDSVLKLSEMLRYVFYDCNKDKVSVSAEVAYINNFIAFQKMKSDGPQDIVFETDSGIHHLHIAPMLFIPFIENSFKYSRIEELSDAFVKIALKHKDNSIIFEISNSIASNKPQSGSGMGLKNVQHRLELLYPNKHTIDMRESENSYEVKLIIHT